ncbi:MAG TPA: hypothetical protein VGI10_13025 [Polyangiaceae bacterium]
MLVLASGACSGSGSSTQSGAPGGGATGGTSGGAAGGSSGTVGASGTSGAAGSSTAATGGTSGASGSGAGSGGTANAAGMAGNSTGPVGFCVLGAFSCPCDSGNACGAGLVCTNGTCCDAASGACSSPSSGTGGAGTGGSGSGAGGGSAASGGATACTPGVTGPVITDCGYPFASSNPLTNLTFSENEVLRAISPSGGAPLASVRLFFNDEHALTLGVHRVVVGSATTDYPVSPLVAVPSAQRLPQTGTNLLTGDQSGLDPSGRPMWPALFVTDTTADPNARSGDWQEGGTPWNPNVVFGTWKGAVRTVAAAGATITPDADPAKNNWNLTTGADPVPTGLMNQGFGAEVRWDLVLVPGHTYRIQIMVHDGDQNKTGGDVGEACVDFCAAQGCPTDSPACTDDSECTQIEGATCTNGCCI